MPSAAVDVRLDIPSLVHQDIRSHVHHGGSTVGAVHAKLRVHLFHYIALVVPRGMLSVS